MAKLTSTARRSLAGILAVWLSGFVFLACCEKINAEGPGKEMCPLARMSPDCDKQERSGQLADAVSESGGSCLDCCSFLPAVFDKSRKLEPAHKLFQAKVTAAVVRFATPGPISAGISLPLRSSYIIDGRHVFLRNRVFRL